MQSSSSPDPWVDTPVWSGQFVHVAGPVSFLYVPPLHAVQAPPSGPVKLALHLQPVAALLPAVLLLLTGHVEQDVALSIPAL